MGNTLVGPERRPRAPRDHRHGRQRRLLLRPRPLQPALRRPLRPRVRGVRDLEGHDAAPRRRAGPRRGRRPARPAVVAVQAARRRAEGGQGQPDQGRAGRRLRDVRARPRAGRRPRRGDLARVRSTAPGATSRPTAAASFAAMRAAAKRAWAERLGRLRVSGGTAADRTTFDSSLYHAQVMPNVFSDVDGRYMRRGRQVHRAAGFSKYANISGWDTYRSQMPLMAMLAPQRGVRPRAQHGRRPAGRRQPAEVGGALGPDQRDGRRPGRPADRRRLRVRGARASTGPPRCARWSTARPNPRSSPTAATSSAPGWTTTCASATSATSRTPTARARRSRREVWGTASTTLEYALADFGIARLAAGGRRRRDLRDVRRARRQLAQRLRPGDRPDAAARRGDRRVRAGRGDRRRRLRRGHRGAVHVVRAAGRRGPDRGARRRRHGPRAARRVLHRAERRRGERPRVPGQRADAADAVLLRLARPPGGGRGHRPQGAAGALPPDARRLPGQRRRRRDVGVVRLRRARALAGRARDRRPRAHRPAVPARDADAGGRQDRAARRAGRRPRQPLHQRGDGRRQALQQHLAAVRPPHGEQAHQDRVLAVGQRGAVLGHRRGRRPALLRRRGGLRGLEPGALWPSPS